MNDFMNEQVQANAVPNEPGKVTVKGGTYIGRNWFLKFPIKTIETTVDFTDDAVILSQKQGYVITKNTMAETTKIPYSSIHFVRKEKKFGIANIIFCVAVGLLSLLMLNFWPLLIIPIVLWMVKHVDVCITHSSVYQIPTDFATEAEELENKINTAIMQSKSGVN